MTRHDRTGDVVDDWPDIPAHEPRCDGHGWIDRDAAPAVPCLDCKPHLRPAELRRKVFGPNDPSITPTRLQETPDDQRK